MNTTNQPMAESLITWKRSRPSSRAARVTRLMFRVVRNTLAVFGLCFVYFLIVGYFQYQDCIAEPEQVCGAISR